MMGRGQGERNMTYAAFDLTGRTAIVTGAGRGLGRGMAAALADAGARVICAGRTKPGIEETADAIRSAGGLAEAFLFDAVRREDCRRLVADTAQRHGRLDIMVVHHGIAWAGAAVSRRSRARWCSLPRMPRASSAASVWRLTAATALFSAMAALAPSRGDGQTDGEAPRRIEEARLPMPPNIYRQHLDRNRANHAPLTPLS